MNCTVRRPVAIAVILLLTCHLPVHLVLAQPVGEPSKAAEYSFTVDHNGMLTLGEQETGRTIATGNISSFPAFSAPAWRRLPIRITDQEQPDMRYLASAFAKQCMQAGKIAGASAFLLKTDKITAKEGYSAIILRMDAASLRPVDMSRFEFDDSHPIKLSPLKTFRVEHYILREQRYDIENNRQIWLRSSKTGKATLLFEHGRGASVHFSPDESHIVINDYAGSDCTHVLLFVRKGDASYVRDGKMDISALAWEAFDKQTGLSSDSLDHCYAEFNDWSTDSKRFTIKLRGYGTKARFVVESWCCLFDVAGQKIVLDKELLKKADVQRVPPK